MAHTTGARLSFWRQSLENWILSELVHSPDENSSSIKEKNRETCDEHLWVKVNTDQSGFYRVKYEDKLAAQLRKAVESNYLSAIDKFGVYHVQQ